MERSLTVDPAPIVLVEGNICCGKTTLCRSLSAELGMDLFLEPVVANPYLTKYYADPPRYALVLQIWILRQRARTYAAAVRRSLASQGGPASEGVLLDRSIFSDSVFAVKNFEDGNITRSGMVEYESLRRTLLALVPRPDLIVYLDVDATECHRRVHEMRQREGEEGIPLAYLAGLETCYEAFIVAMKSGDIMATTGSEAMVGPAVPVARVAWNEFGDAAAVGATMRAELRRCSNTAQPPLRADLAAIERDLEALEEALLASERNARDAAEAGEETVTAGGVEDLTKREAAFSRAERDRSSSNQLETTPHSVKVKRVVEETVSSPSSIAQLFEEAY
tara:strand:+ start:44 stop:1051 length:1008 start_codon:yes stop_codon:yes gene_type:complete